VPWVCSSVIGDCDDAVGDILDKAWFDSSTASTGSGQASSLIAKPPALLVRIDKALPFRTRIDGSPRKAPEGTDL